MMVPFENAIKMMISGDYEGARALLLGPAQHGDVHACIEMGHLEVFTGRGNKESSKWIERAEKNLNPKDPDQLYALHLAYSRSLGRDDYLKQRKKAFEYLLQAANVGEAPRVIMQVGLHYGFGLNTVEIDLKEAERWLRRAAESGDPLTVRALEDFLKPRARRPKKKK